MWVPLYSWLIGLAGARRDGTYAPALRLCIEADGCRCGVLPLRSGLHSSMGRARTILSPQTLTSTIGALARLVPTPVSLHAFLNRFRALFTNLAPIPSCPRTVEAIGKVLISRFPFVITPYSFAPLSRGVLGVISAEPMELLDGFIRVPFTFAPSSAQPNGGSSESPHPL